MKQIKKHQTIISISKTIVFTIFVALSLSA